MIAGGKRAQRDAPDQTANMNPTLKGSRLNIEARPLQGRNIFTNLSGGGANIRLLAPAIVCDPSGA